MDNYIYIYIYIKNPELNSNKPYPLHIDILLIHQYKLHHGNFVFRTRNKGLTLVYESNLT
jgi:hypothetical protein